MSFTRLLQISTLLAGPTAAVQFLAPEQDINLPASATASSPLQWLGANSPWFAGPDVYSIPSTTSDNCAIDQTAYIVRHGSRYPDQGAYNGWVEMASRFAPSNGYTATGSLSFLTSWKPVLTNPSLQIAMESPTGYKEAHDLGYTLRTRYPNLYSEGEKFFVWANNYTRVLQTAQNFMHGFLGSNAATNGIVVSVTSKGFSAAVGDTLAPGDMCPNFHDDEGSDQVGKWNNIYIPPIQRRLQQLTTGNLTLTANDISQIPYLCGFESQITGRLSPWCGVLTDEELKQYEYANDMRYYYGVGPGTDLEKTMMTPFLDALMRLFAQGPGVKGKSFDGDEFAVPSILTAFLNDGQLTQLVTASGVMDGQADLDPTSKDDNRTWIASRFTTMRGTIAFERMTCSTTCKNSGQGQNRTFVRIRLNDAVYRLPGCHNGPGQSCALDKYRAYVSKKLASEGDFVSNCNVTVAGAPTQVKGASFFTDLTSPWLKSVAP